MNGGIVTQVLAASKTHSVKEKATAFLDGHGLCHPDPVVEVSASSNVIIVTIDLGIPEARGSPNSRCERGAHVVLLVTLGVG